VVFVQGDRERSSNLRVPVPARDIAIIRGTVSFPWGVVGGGTVVVGERSATSDSAGRYEISALTPGAYTVTAKAPFPGYETSPQKVEVAAGETKIVDICFDFEKAVVEGHVYDQDGKPIIGATLSGLQSGKEMEAMTTDERGYFRFERATPGDRHIRVNAQGCMGETRDFTASQDKATVIEFRLARATCKIYGVVTDGSGQPLQAEMLLRRSGAILERTLSDAKTGYYEFPLVPGTYMIRPSAPGREIKPWEGSISADTKVDFNLPPVHPIERGDHRDYRQSSRSWTGTDMERYARA